MGVTNNSCYRCIGGSPHPTHCNGACRAIEDRLMKTMTPVLIEVLLFIATRPTTYPNPSDATTAAITYLKSAELIVRNNEAGECATVHGVPYTATDRGKALVKKWCETPLPIAVTTWQ